MNGRYVIYKHLRVYNWQLELRIHMADAILQANGKQCRKCKVVYRYSFDRSTLNNKICQRIHRYSVVRT